MKKYLFVLIFGICSMNISFAQITVSGTGCDPLGFTPVDGSYTTSSTKNGKNLYIDGSTFLTIEWTGTQWMFNVGGGEILYTNASDVGVNPPATGWSTGTGSCAGKPTPALAGDVGTLPVELVDFSVESKNGATLLNWQTATELNNEMFEIERSQNGEVFYPIGIVSGNGTTLEAQEYSFKDEKPLNGMNYYRLKQIDFDGQFEYSKVISIHFKVENRAVGEFYPNPSKSGLVNMNYVATNNENIAISVLDLTGKLIVNQIQQVVEGNNKLNFNFSTLNQGIYIVRLGNNTNSTYRKLIIK